MLALIQPSPIRKRGRFCALCGKAMRRHDKYKFFEGAVRHKDCDDPTLSKVSAAAEAEQPALTEGNE